jgi:hypothetical protein
MIRPGFLDPALRKDLTDLARDGSVAHRLARRASALVLLDQGMRRGQVAKKLLLDDDTVRTWHRLDEEDGIEGLASFGCEGGACRLSDVQQDKLRAWITKTLPRGIGALDRPRARWPQIPSCYAMTGWRRTQSWHPAVNIRFSTATPTAASVCWAAKPRARSRGPISAL